MKTILVAVFLMTNSLAYSQAVTWQKWYDYGHNDEAAWDALQTYDGGYAVLSTSFSSPDSTVLMKLDSLGNIQMEKTLWRFARTTLSSIITANE